MMDINFRIMDISDHKKAVELWQSLPGMGLSGADERDEIEKFIERNPLSCWVAEKNNMIIGTILGGNDGRRGYIYHLAVHQVYQSQGIGKILIKHCLDAFRDAGIQKCHLMVYQDNSDGIKFWQHQGWVIREDVFTMSKAISE